MFKNLKILFKTERINLEEVRNRLTSDTDVICEVRKQRDKTAIYLVSKDSMQCLTLSSRELEVLRGSLNT